MKNTEEFEDQASGQQRGSARAAFPAINRHDDWFSNQTNLNPGGVVPAGFVSAGYPGRADNRLCKGPPGMARSPGLGQVLLPEHPPNIGAHKPKNKADTPYFPPLSPREGLGVSQKFTLFVTQNALKQKNNNKQILFLNNPLIFKIMKKHVLFLTLFLAALFAGTKSYAQQVDTDHMDAVPGSCPTPTALSNCGQGDPLHPVAGVSYNYVVDHTGGAGSVVHWFVADDTTPLLTTGGVTATIDPGDGNGDYILTTTAATYNKGTAAGTPNTSPSIDITWKAFDGTTNSVVLVAFVTDAAGCTNNIQAWKIEPQYSFILQIAGVEDDGTVHTADNASECAFPVQSAIWNGTSIAMDYGDNYIFYVVSAANFVHGWQPSFSAAIAGGASTLGAIQWAYADEANSGTATNWHDATDPVLAAHYSNVSNDAIGSDGACIVLRVNVDHGNVEVATAPELVTMTVDGVMYNTDTDAYDTKYPDLDDSANSGDPCVVGSNDTAVYEISTRPDITPNTPGDPFVGKN